MESIGIPGMLRDEKRLHGIICREKRVYGKGVFGCVLGKECDYHSATEGGSSVVSEQLKFLI